MYIRVSKTIAKFINKTAKELGFKAHAEVITLPYQTYSLHTGENVVDASFNGDYDYETREFKVIMVTYPDEYYACPRYLTTMGLSNAFKNSGVTDVDGLKEWFRDMLEV